MAMSAGRGDDVGRPAGRLGGGRRRRSHRPRRSDAPRRTFGKIRRDSSHRARRGEENRVGGAAGERGHRRLRRRRPRSPRRPPRAARRRCGSAALACAASRKRRPPARPDARRRAPRAAPRRLRPASSSASATAAASISASDGGGDAPVAAHDRRAVGRRDRGVHQEKLAVVGGVRADRRLTAAAQRAQKRALGAHGEFGLRIVEQRRARARCADRRRASRSRARLARPPARARRARNGTVCVARQPSRFSPAAASTIASYSPSRSLRNRVSTLPRISSIGEVGAQRAQLRAPARARRADARAGRQRVERGVVFAAERIARIFALADRGQRHVVGQRARQILARMHRVVGAPLAQREFQFFDEDAVGAERGRARGPGPRRLWS